MRPGRQYIQDSEFQAVRQNTAVKAESSPAMVAIDKPVAERIRPLRVWPLFAVALVSCLAALQLGISELSQLHLAEAWPHWWFLFLGICLVVIGLASVWSLHRQLRDLWSHEALRAKLQSSLITGAKPNDLCLSYARTVGLSERWQESLSQAHSPLDSLELLDRMVLSELDRRARSLITKAGRDTAALCIVSPFTAVDALMMLILQWNLLKQLLQNYGVKPGFLSLAALFIAMLKEMAINSGAEVLIDSFTEAIGTSILAKVSGKASSAALTALLVCRFGRVTVQRIRPLPVSSDSFLLKDLLLEAINPFLRKEKAHLDSSIEAGRAEK